MLDVLIESAPLLYAGVFVLGALIGSFLNVVILRLPPLLEYDWRCQCHELLELEQEASDPPVRHRGQPLEVPPMRSRHQPLGEHTPVQLPGAGRQVLGLQGPHFPPLPGR